VALSTVFAGRVFVYGEIDVDDLRSFRSVTFRSGTFRSGCFRFAVVHTLDECACAFMLIVAKILD
jgi:hypothetical protein